MKKITFLVLSAILSAGPAMATPLLVESSGDLPMNSQSPLVFHVEGSQDQTLQTEVLSGKGARVGHLRQVSDKTLIWDGTDSSGKRVQPGQYFVQIAAESSLWNGVVSVHP